MYRTQFISGCKEFWDGFLSFSRNTAVLLFQDIIVDGREQRKSDCDGQKTTEEEKAFSSSFSRVLCICSYGTVQETGMEICRKLSYRESRDYLTSNPTRNFWCTSTLETILHVTLKLQYQFNQNFRSSGPFSSQNSTKMPF